MATSDEFSVLGESPSSTRGVGPTLSGGFVSRIDAARTSALKLRNLFGQYHPQSQGNVWSLGANRYRNCIAKPNGGPRFFAANTDYLFAKETRLGSSFPLPVRTAGLVGRCFSLLIEQNDKMPSDWRGVEARRISAVRRALFSKRIAKLLGEAGLGAVSKRDGAPKGARTWNWSGDVFPPHRGQPVESNWCPRFVEGPAVSLGQTDLKVFRRCH